MSALGLYENYGGLMRRKLGLPWERWEYRTRYWGPMTIEYWAWRWRRPWRVSFAGVCIPTPVGWTIHNFAGRGRTLEEACRKAEQIEEQARIAAVWRQAP